MYFNICIFSNFNVCIEEKFVDINIILSSKSFRYIISGLIFYITLKLEILLFFINIIIILFYIKIFSRQIIYQYNKNLDLQCGTGSQRK